MYMNYRVMKSDEGNGNVRLTIRMVDYDPRTQMPCGWSKSVDPWSWVNDGNEPEAHQELLEEVVEMVKAFLLPILDEQQLYEMLEAQNEEYEDDFMS